MVNYYKTLDAFLNKSILFKFKFGFTGEAYINSNEFEGEYYKSISILEKYFSYKKPFYCNRNSTYYSKDLLETIDLIKYINSDACKILNTDIACDIKRYIIFTLTEYMLSCIAKIIGVVFSYASLKQNYYIVLKTYLLELTDYLVSILFNEDLSQFPTISVIFIDRVLSDIKGLGISDVREYSEMDNILVMFISYFAFSDYIEQHDLIISPLQGAALLAPFYISMYKYTCVKNKRKAIDFEYVRFSRYDNSHYCQASLGEQIKLLSTQYPDSTKIILIDDNTGTAITLNTIKLELLKSFNNVSTCAVEYYWEAKLYKADTYPAFQLEEIDLITPICYRHFKKLDEHIAYIKSGNELHSWYKDNSFSKLNMIYDEIDYCAYINNNCKEESVKARAINIYNRIRHIIDTMQNKYQ